MLPPSRSWRRASSFARGTGAEGLGVGGGGLDFEWERGRRRERERKGFLLRGFGEGKESGMMWGILDLGVVGRWRKREV